MKKLALLLLLISPLLVAQNHFPVNDQVAQNNTNYTAFTNATLHLSPTQTIKNATLLIQNGKVVNAGARVSVPQNSIVIDLNGKHIYPSFIDVYSDFGVEKPKGNPTRGRSPQYDPTRTGYYWNDHIRTEIQAVNKFNFDNKAASELIKSGFGAVGTHHHDGIARGTGMVVTLNTEGNNSQRILQPNATQHFSFTRSAEFNQAYPSSVMGVMALLRQMYHDAAWYESGKANTRDLALEALIKNKNLPAIFESKDKLNNLRAHQIGALFGINYIIVGSGFEYENINEVKATEATYIISLNFPDAFDVSNPYLAGHVSLQDMRRWNQAPTNPAVLEQNNISFAFTTHNLKSPDQLLTQIQKAISHGLSPETALKSLTTIPAQILKNNQMGNLNSGSHANFLITSGPIFDKNTTLYENWVQGQRTILNDFTQKDIRGTYQLNIASTQYTMNIEGSLAQPTVKITQDTLTLKSSLTYSNNWVSILLTHNDQTYRMAAAVQKESNNLSGRLFMPNGNETSFSAIQTAAFNEKDANEENDTPAPTVVPVSFPNLAYGNAKLPEQETLLFANATVWTNEAQGILENTDVLVRNGKIAQIGQNLSARNARVIDATGKHLTAGIIDEHSHLALTSVNEMGHNSSAEVSMEDVIDPDDVGIYRALAGGVTTAQLLHGSANPIGGQSAIVKFKWGESPRGMIFEEAPKFIKFALGENVKQSNWGAIETVRFPQTRMGVEQVYHDYFSRAQAYQAQNRNSPDFRYDEEMEVLSQILNGNRHISCHSYVQSEINMLMKVADEFDFKINTFTHILEGYKVADKMLEHGVRGASTFSDWWAFKFEVNDAIPYNAALMHKVGLTVGMNSDDPELIRRLNQDAAKAVKYGGVSEEEAWKMVTLNPAIMLRIDHRVGSIKEGKDADLVLWSNNPLSMYARAEKTLIEGAVYFSIEEDLKKRRAITAERTKLIHLMIDQKNNGAPTQTPARRPLREFHCDTNHLEEEAHGHQHHHH